ncbi:MAG: FAD-dependent oxidoreductase [SAR202 cluster bacterium]|nr:FAD-dependent oxidoreductase [SAR202 cluster bacterium]
MVWLPTPARRLGEGRNGERGPAVDPDVDRAGTPEFIAEAMEFLRDRIPEMAKGRAVEARGCLYENSPDDHFIIDRLPGRERIFVAAGGSGHGFKFGSSIGPVIADAVEDRQNPLGDLFRVKGRLQSPGEIERSNFSSRGFAVPGGGAE